MESDNQHLPLRLVTLSRTCSHAASAQTGGNSVFRRNLVREKLHYSNAVVIGHCDLFSW